MTVLVLLQSPPAGSASFALTDTGTGSDSAVALLNDNLQFRPDIAFGSEFANVSVAGAGVGGLPQVFLDVAFDASAGPVYTEAVALALPTVYYRLSEASGPVIDQMGRLNLTVAGGVTRLATSLLSGDPSDESYDFNGSTGYLFGFDNGLFDIVVQEGDTPDVITELTLEAVIRPDSVTGIRSIIARGVTGTDAPIFDLRIFNGFLQFTLVAVVEGVEQTFTYTTTQVLAIATEYHVACVVNEISVALYINGDLAAYFPKSWTMIKQFSASYLAIGSSKQAVPANFFDGRIDEPAVYEYAVSSESVNYHAHSRSTSISFTWTPISDDVISSSRQVELSVKRGRTDIFRDPETGLMQSRLRNQDRRFDPGNTSSPYFPNVDPARPCRVRAIKNGVSYNLFRGDTEDWPQDWKGRVNEVPLTSLDGFEPLSRARVIIDAPVETTGERIGRILNAAGWPSSLRDIDQGSTLVQAWVQKEGSALELLFLMVASESGHTYIDGEGKVVFRDRLARANPPLNVVKATFSNIPSPGEFPFVHADVGEDKDQIINHVTIKVTDGPTFVAQDALSVERHRQRSYEVELPLFDHTEAEIKAHWILQLFKEPFTRIKSVVVEPQMDDSMWPHVLGREMGDLLRFKIYPPGSGVLLHDLQAVVEHVEHKYIIGRWTTTWTLSPADVNKYWILGTSTIGVDNKVAY